MRAEVQGGRRSRPASVLGPTSRPVEPGPEYEDSQAEWARQEQQVRPLPLF